MLYLGIKIKSNQKSKLRKSKANQSELRSKLVWAPISTSKVIWNEIVRKVQI